MKLALGTVQFGLPYGTFNRAGAVPESEVAACLELAAGDGIDILDTARAYGGSEAVLGRLQAARSFRIVTKVAPLNGAGGAAVSDSLRASLEALRAESLYALLLHRSEDLLSRAGPEIWHTLERAREEGRAERIGVSVYTPQEAEAILERYPIDIVQAPFNAFDQRFKTSGAFHRLASQGVEVHVRSLFLQGFALADPETLPPHLAPYRSSLVSFRIAAANAGMTPLEFALAAAAQEPAIGRATVGVQSLGNLREVVAAAAKPMPTVDFGAFASEEEAFINPSLWPLQPE